MSDDTLNDEHDTTEVDVTLEEHCEVSDEGFVIETEERVVIEADTGIIDELNRSMEDYVENHQQGWEQAWQESIATFEQDVIAWQDTIKTFELDIINWQDHVATFKAIEKDAISQVQSTLPDIPPAPRQSEAPQQTKSKPAPRPKVKSKLASKSAGT